MFEHQVCSDVPDFAQKMKIIDPLSENTLFYDVSMHIPEKIKNSQRFSVGDHQDIFKVVVKNGCVEKSLYEIAKLPYKRFWMEFTGTNRAGQKHKSAIFVEEDLPDVLRCLTFQKVGSRKKGSWGMARVGFYAAFTTQGMENASSIPEFMESLQRLAELKGLPIAEAAYFIPMQLVSEQYLKGSRFAEQIEREIRAESKGMYVFRNTLLCTLLLLNCKNIVTEKHEAPERLNKKRQKAGKPPLFSYHTLAVKVPGESTASKSGAKTGITQRLHLCRGHFKHFTKDKPLFGKLEGLYWWQPHVRGEKKKGVVMKDYHLVPNQQ